MSWYSSDAVSLDEESAAETIDWLIELIKEEFSWSTKLDYKIAAINLSVSLRVAFERAAMLYLQHDLRPAQNKIDYFFGIPVNWTEQLDTGPMVSFLRTTTGRAPAGSVRD